jgi:hypothetical protein
MKLVAAAVMAIFGLVACTETAPPVGKAPGTPVATVEPTGKGGPPATPPTTLDLRLAVVSFSCRLPISIDGDRRGAFVEFPQGDVAIANATGSYYDRAYSRWLPVPRAAVAPDGRHYATVELGDQGTFTIHVVDVATGKDAPLHESDATFNFPPDVLDYAAEGIYLDNGFERGQAGLWLVDPATGAIRQLSNSWIPTAIDHGYVWSEVLNPADPNPVNTASSAGILANEIDRIDLKTGARETWMYRPGTGLSIVGFDTVGRPLIVAGKWGLDLEAMLLLAIDPATQLNLFQGDLAQTFRGAIGDAHGTWLGSSQGVYLYEAADGLRKVSNQPGMPANGCF